MNSIQARQSIEQIITMPAADVAAQHVQDNLQSLQNSTYTQTLMQMTREEYQRNGLSRRHRALTKLGEYTSALYRRQRLLEIDPQGAMPALPELMVVTPQNSAEEYCIDDEEDESDAFGEWLQILTGGRQPHIANLAVNPHAPHDDLAKFEWLADINNRLLATSLQTTRKPATDEDIRELLAIENDCNNALAAGGSAALREKKADTLRYIASAYDSRGDSTQAKSYYKQAADAFTQINMNQKANRCLTAIAWVEFSHEGNVDAIEHLHTLIEKIPHNTLEHTSYLIELAQMYSSADEDYEAEQILQRAENELQDLGHTTPTGKEIADALTQSLTATLSEQGDTDTTPIVVQSQVRNLYRRLYFIYEQIYRRKGDLDRADEYLKLLAQMDGSIKEGNQMNQEFSEKLLNSMPALFEQMNKLFNDDEEA